MTRYTEIQTKARQAGIDTVRDNHGAPRGYWITQADGNPLWPDDSFTTSLDELASMVSEHIRSIDDQPMRFKMSHGPDGDIRMSRQA